MTPRNIKIVELLGAICLFSSTACAPTQGSDFQFSLSFAGMEQAQTGSGIPQEVHSIRLTAYDKFGAKLASECLSLSADASERSSVSMDLAPSAGIKLEVQGWTDSECGGDKPVGLPPWYGSASGVVVSEGRETPVVLQVRRMGKHLNLLRENLNTPRAFATATCLDNDEVLVAGGFSRVLEYDGSTAVLQAACSAEIVDVASATVKRLVPMQSCRGLHQAFKLSDGRVVLLGGSQEALFDPGQNAGQVLRPKVENLLQSVEIYDPGAKEFSLLSTDNVTMRAMSTGALLDDGTLILAGGRTSTIRSSDVVDVNTSESNPTWTIRANAMVTARAGAVATLVDKGLLVIGGNLSGQPDVELLPLDDRPSMQVQVNGQTQYSMALSGHALNTIGSSLILTGGIPNSAGGTPVYDLLWGAFDSGSLSLLGNTMVRARAYHSTGIVGCADAEPCLAVFGGLDSTMKSTADAELVRVNSDGELLPDSLETGAVGTAVANLPDGSVLVVGGLDVDSDGVLFLSSTGQILTP